MKMTHMEAESVAREMDRMTGGHFFSATRTVEVDDEGNWLYYISTVYEPPAEYRTLSSVSRLEHDARAHVEMKREVMRMIGSAKSERKATASRENGKRGGRPRKKPADSK